eukprot:COSAG06_NODE_55187_length_290_cov_22.853403_1_plen_50_part_10
MRFYLYTHVAHRCATGCLAFVVKTTSVPPQPSSSLVRYLTARQPSMPNVA